MNVIKLVIILIISIFALIAVIRFVTPEDTWMCDNGTWVKHGNPSAPMPVTVCP